MPRPRLSLIVLAAVAGLLALAAVVLFGLVRLSWFERQAEQRLSAALDWPVRLGDVAIAYYPLPSIEADGVVLPADAGAEAPPLLEIGHVSVAVPWRTVAGLGGHLTRLELRAPRLHLERGSDDAGNWEGLLDRVVALSGEGPSSFSIGELQVSDGSVDYLSAAGERSRLAGVQLAARDVRPGKPFDLELRGGGETAGGTFHLTVAGRAMLDPDRDVYAADELTLSGWVGGGDLPLAGVEWDGTVEALHADLTAGRTTLRGLRARTMGMELTGEAGLATGDGTRAATFTLETGPFSPRTVGIALGRPLPETSDPGALTRAVLRVAGNWGDGGLTVSGLEGKLDGSRFAGEAMFPVGDAPPRLRVTLDRLDVERYLQPASAGAESDGTVQAAVESLRGTLQDLDLEAEIEIDEVRAAGVVARQVSIRVAPMSQEGAE